MKTKKILTLLTALLIFASFLTSCDGLPVVVEESTADNTDSFTNPETGITYISCSMGVMPLTPGELYCKLDNYNKYREIKYQDPLEYICDDTEFTSGVYRASTLPDITVANFEPIAALVYKEKDVAIFMGQLNAEKQYLDESLQDLIDSYEGVNCPIRDDSEYTYALRDAMLGEPVDGVYPYLGTVEEDSMLHVRLLSAKYPGLTYIVVYYRSLVDGNDYLFDYGTKLSYECPIDVAYRLWEYLE